MLDDGSLWPTAAEAFRLAREATVRADHEAARTEAERRRGDALAARLREAGIDPEA